MLSDIARYNFKENTIRADRFSNIFKSDNVPASGCCRTLRGYSLDSEAFSAGKNFSGRKFKRQDKILITLKNRRKRKRL